MKYKLLFIALLSYSLNLYSANPIILNKGVCDPHIHIFNGKAYVYATHDRSIENKNFAMDDWWIWSSDDLVSWKLESVLKPQDTYIGKSFSDCWATDAAYMNGKYYWYFSGGRENIGVVVGNTPVGPWKDILGKPIVPSTITPVAERDPAVFKDDDGVCHIIFGVFDFYMSQLNNDMTSLATPPRKIVINNPIGPYGKDKTDDKPFMHKHNGLYYLSWGCFYAVSKNLYGPYDYVGSVISKESFVPGDQNEYKRFDKGSSANNNLYKPLYDRHGSFFELNNQTYFAYNDLSTTNNGYFRNTFISYIHYKNDGEIAPIRVDEIGVGEYDASQNKIEAEDYFKAKGIKKEECLEGGFMVSFIENKSFIEFPNIKGLEKKSKITIRASLDKSDKVILEVHESSPKGKLIKTCNIIGSDGQFKDYIFELPKIKEAKNLCFVYKSNSNFTKFQWNWFSFK